MAETLRVENIIDSQAKNNKLYIGFGYFHF